MPEHGSGIAVPVARVYGRLERVSGDTLFVRVAGGISERGRPMRLALADAPLAIMVSDTERVDVRRFSAGWTTVAVLGGLIAIWAIVMASACIMCGFGEGGETPY